MADPRAPRASKLWRIVMLICLCQGCRLPGPSGPGGTNLRDPRLESAPRFDTAGKTKTRFDGQTLEGWQVADFAGGGEVTVEGKALILSMGATLTGVAYTNPVPARNYEISLRARRLEGSDFFCGRTFPVKESHATLIRGGWGGAVVGLSSIDGADASMNETTQYHRFEKDRWYLVRVKVTDPAIQVWLDDERIMNLPLAGRTIALRSGEIEKCRPLGVATWQTSGEVKDLRLKILP